MIKSKLIIPALASLTTAAAFSVNSMSVNVLENNFNYEFNEQLLSSSMFTDLEETNTYVQPAVDMTGFTMAGSNSSVALYYHPDTLAIRVVNQATGYVWSSDLEGNMPAGIAPIYEKRINSPFSFVYISENYSLKNVSMQQLANEVEITTESNKVTFNVEFSQIGITIKYSIALTEDGFSLEFSSDDVIENGKYKLVSVTFFEYFGATFEDEEKGYTFLPFNNGGLVRHSSESSVSNTVTMPMLSYDYNFGNLSKQGALSFPVYGIANGVGENALFVEVEDGYEYGTLGFTPASSSPFGYSSTSAAFNLRNTYSLAIPGGDPVQRVSEDIYGADIKINYSVLSGNEADYVGMANTYKEDLVSDGRLNNQISSGDDITLSLDVVGGDSESGFLFDKYIEMTTFEDVKNINQSLAGYGIENVNNMLRGFNKDGYFSRNAGHYGIERKLGKVDTISGLNYDFYYNPLETYKWDYGNDKYSLVQANSSYAITVAETWDAYKVYNSIPKAQKEFSKDTSKYNGNVALDGYSDLLYSDINSGYDKGDIIDMTTSMLGDKYYQMFTPRIHVMSNAKSYRSIELVNKSYKVLTDSVPFTQIVLSGYVESFSKPINFSSDPYLDLLFAIEFGTYPTFLITEQPTYKLANAYSSQFYSTEYARLEETIVSFYNYANSILSGVKGEKIVNREVLEVGVSKITYSNGKVVVVNYTGDDYTYLGNIVSSGGAILV